MAFLNQPFRVAIIGGGVSGSLLAVQLLRRARSPLQVLLIERTGDFGRGVAYSTRCPDHLLNVPAGRMSAFPDQPEHFLRWLQRRHDFAQAQGGDFVPREIFGEYVQGVLTDAQTTAAPDVRLETITAEAHDIEEEGEGLVVHFADGRTLAVDRVVLAIGNLPGEYPILRSLPVYDSPRYVHIPWQGNPLEGVGDKDDVLLVGQGLTATDLIVQLWRRGHQGNIHALSRRGIRPQAHGLSAAPRPLGDTQSVAPTIRAWTKRIRREIAIARAEGADWRAVIDGLRPHTQAIWQSFSWDERARFMRHVRPFWDPHRHRVAPATAQVIDRLVGEGRLKFYAGRLQVLEADDEGVHALVRRRGSIQHIALRVAKIINCTGARTDYTKYQHPLLIHLLARGLIGHDPLALGINALPSGEVLRYRGEAIERVFTLGAPLKGTLWESTAVPEIRMQASALAERLLESQTLAAVEP